MNNTFNLESKLVGLSDDLRVLYLAELCGEFVPAIRRYFRFPWRRRYTDSVVGMVHRVDVDLPQRALETVLAPDDPRKLEEVERLLAEYREPIVAMQDMDLEIKSNQADYGYLAIYNLLRLCEAPSDVETGWIVAKQALSAVLPEGLSEEEEAQFMSRHLEEWWSRCLNQYATEQSNAQEGPRTN